MARFDYGMAIEGEERFVDRRDGTRLRTISAGTGDRTAVLAHGYGSTADSWSLVAHRLVERGYTVVAFDQRGHGRSTIGADGVGSQQMASDYAAILEAFEVENGVLVGHSMGGFLSLAFLLDDRSPARERISALMLMATFAGDVNRNSPQNRLQIPLIRFGILPGLIGFGPVAQAFAKSLIGKGYEREMGEAFATQFGAAQHSKLVPILEAMVNESRYDRLGELDLPTTVMVGTEDKTTPPFHTADLHAGIAGSRLVTLQDVGHAPNWEAPDTVASEIGQLLAI